MAKREHNALVKSETGSPRVIAGVTQDGGQIIVNMSGGDIAGLLAGRESGGQLLLFDVFGQKKLDLPDDAPLF